MAVGFGGAVKSVQPRRFLALAAALTALSCGGGDVCENTSLAEIPSPDGALRAWVFIRSCGATTLNSVHVSVLPASAPAPVEAGNTFVREPVAAVLVEWPAEDALLISHELGGNVSRQEPEVAGVAVSYEVD
jgi:hypothetical protein